MVQSELEATKRYGVMRPQLEQLKSEPVSRAVFFWWNPTIGMQEETCVPDLFLLNLKAAAQVFKTVDLLVFQPLKKAMCPRLSVLDARNFLSEQKASDLLQRGWKVQHLADYVRLMALRQTGGFFADLDQLWLDPQKLTMHKNAFGHLGSSVDVWRMRGPKKLWLKKYLRKPAEEVYFSVPLHFPKSSPILEPWSADICQYLSFNKKFHSRSNVVRCNSQRSQSSNSSKEGAIIFSRYTMEKKEVVKNLINPGLINNISNFCNRKRGKGPLFCPKYQEEVCAWLVGRIEEEPITSYNDAWH